MAKISALVRAKLTRAQSLAAAGRTAEAIQLLEQVCRKEPRSADAWFIQGTIFGNAGKFRHAIDCLQRATTLNPRHVLAYFNLANALSGQGRFSEAVTALSRALKLEPRRPEIIRALARAEVNCGRPKEAARWYRQYLQSKPGDPEVLGNLGACYFHSGELEEAGKCYRQALTLRNEAAWLDGLGATLCRQGKLGEAIDAHRAAVRLQPDNPRYRSNLLLTLHYLPDASPAAILQEHRQWGQVHRGGSLEAGNYVNTAEPGRRIRVGYVSPDFRTHSVSYYFEPLLRHHSSDSVETFCYACSPREDETTTRLQDAAHHWRDISMLDDRQAIERIRADGIDILVDLAGHTAGNRLMLFMAKPAPVQITWLGYPATTGLAEIDYRMTDQVADPEGNDSSCSEQLLRLPGCFLCYEPYAGSPPVAPSPVFENGYVTFGSFNNLAKINEDVIALWSALLQSVPESRLLVKNPSLSDTATVDRYKARFAQHSINPERVELLGLAPDTEAHLDTYRLIDIALDTFPYNGTTTTCEALYMGVPVVTLAGQAHAGRVGASLLSALGLEEMVTASHDEYLAMARQLAENPAGLTELRDSLRSRMIHSQLCDGQAFAHKLEQAYRGVWCKWCASQAARQDSWQK
jgi:predicted O-linked N-acetylglucosamine transferase (SPINDLY family)